MQTVSMSSYFDVLSWTRARKNTEALEKTNPQNPVLNDDDEQFLQKITSQEAPAPPLPTIEPTVIDDEGNEKQADTTQKEAAEMILPASPGEEKEKRTWASFIPNVGVPSVPAIPSLASLRGSKGNAKPEEKEAAPATEEKDATSEKPSETSTQDDKNDAADKVEELAETAKETAQETKDETAKNVAQDTKDEPTSESTTTSQPAAKEADDTPQEPESEQKEETDDHEPKEDTVDSTPKESTDNSTHKEITDDSKSTEETADSKAETTDSKDDKPAESTQRTWASYIPSVPTFSRNTKAHEAAEAAAKAQSPEAKEQDEREVSVLLDRLNLSAINNRVFSFSDQSQRLYSEFTLILKDIVNGAPTAWEDLETLLKENEKHLEQMFKNMPPFVQTLVKSLPAKFASSMGPEIMAMAGDKPGNDLKKQMEAASVASSSASAANPYLKKKQKRKVPNIKDLASSKGTVTSMLTNIVNFLKVRFPAFVTGTNVVMSLAVFILLFVFYYCHKRGKEVRMLRESESAKESANVSEIETSSEDEEEEKQAVQGDDKVDEKQETAQVEAEAESDEEEIKIANAKAYAAAMHRAAVGGPDNAAALRAKKVLES
ncbi:hypothetical protein KCU93_g3621, partial [Aureobasidium melanogenum]